MARIVIVGAGSIGQATATHLVDNGHQVTLASRSGTDPVPGARAVVVDAGDADALALIAHGADAIVNAVNPPYTSWPRDWPPMAAALLTAAEQAGAGLVTIGNLYGYGRVDAPMRELDPLHPNGHKGRVRAKMWADALAAHEAGRVRAVEVRASDYFGAQARKGVSYLNQYVITPALRGRTVWLAIGAPDVPHSWTYLPDIGALAATLAVSPPDSGAWGRPWHVPTSEPRTVRQVAAEAAQIAGRPAPAVRPLPSLVRQGMRLVPMIRELEETAHQHSRPFVLDSSAAQATFELRPTPWDEALEATCVALRG